MQETIPLSPKVYQPSKQSLWQGKNSGADTLRFQEVIQCVDFSDPSFHASDISQTWALIGFACDEGVKRNNGRPGAAQGPAALRQALASLPFSLPSTPVLYDLGDIICTDGDLEEAQAALGIIVSTLIRKKIFPIVMGGGHECAWGNYRGISAAYPNRDCAVINFDAHFDLRPSPTGKSTSGTSFRQIAESQMTEKGKADYCVLGIQTTANTKSLFQKAAELQTTVLLAEEFHEGGSEASVETVESIAAKADIIHLSLCMDVFAAPFAPGVSAPQPLGIYPWHAIPAIRKLAASGKVASFDIAELCPSLDNDGITAKLAASLVSLYIHNYFYQSR